MSTDRWLARFLGRLRHWGGVSGLSVVMMACVPLSLPNPLAKATLEESVPFAQIAAPAIWISQPAALLGLQRSFAGETEQIVALSNDTTLPGDNFILMVAYVRKGEDLPAFRLEEFVRRAGGAPAPFSKVSDRDLRSGSDSLGTFFWLEYRSGASTNCVLAIRRLGLGSRILPAQSSVMDVMVRNCVLGTIDQALDPIRDDRMGFGTGSSGGGATRLLSPLAGPSP